jgi:hypothetical protein
VIDVRGEPWIRIRVIERLVQQHLVDGIRGGLDFSRASEVFAEGFANQIAQGHPARFGRLRGAAMKVRREQELGPVHV